MATPVKERGTQRWSFWRELPLLIVVALVLALVIKAFVVQSFRIPSGSMEDTLRIGDWILVNKLIYHFRGVDRGDIVVFNGEGSWDPPSASTTSPGLVPRTYHDVLRWVGLETDGTDYIKRVIGLPGDHVVCCDPEGRITVNGVPLNEGSYLFPGSDPSVQQFKIVVPPGRIWVMGDHRADSADSRYHMQGPGDGTVPLNQVVGRAFAVFWPLSQLQALSIPATFKQAALDTMGIPAAVPWTGGAAGASRAGTAAGGAGGVPRTGSAAGASRAGGVAGADPRAGGVAGADPLAGGLAVTIPAIWLLRRFRGTHGPVLTPPVHVPGTHPVARDAALQSGGLARGEEHKLPRRRS